MNAVTSPRARLVELLWQLKQTYDQQGDQKLRFIHFNTLLNNANYRAELIETARKSPDRRLQKIGEELLHLNRDGSLLHKRSEGRIAGEPMMLNPDIAETIGRQTPDGSVRRWTNGVILGVFTILLSVVIALYGRTLYSTVKGERIVSGTIASDQTWDADTVWVLQGKVYVDQGATLTVMPGTVIKGQPGSALVVTRSAGIHARGSARSPIVFTSAKPEGSRSAGDWGGLVLLGSAPVNVAGAHIEGLPEDDARGAFGGSDPSHSCGVLSHVRVEFAGYEAYRDNELNGITLGGCGSDSIVENVQVHRALDDGIEVFGGTVDLRNIIISGAGDDSLDWDMGWQGRVQFLIVQQHSATGDNAFEGDNNSDDHDASPRSNPVFYNVTLVSPRSHEKHHRAMTLRRGTAGSFNNMVITGFSAEAVDIRDSSTVKQALDGDLSFSSIVLHRIGSRGTGWFEKETLARDDDGNFSERHFFEEYGTSISFGVDPMLPAEARDPLNPAFTPFNRSPLRNRSVPVPQGEFWDEGANYVGAVRPGSADTWFDGWAAFPAY